MCVYAGVLSVCFGLFNDGFVFFVTIWQNIPNKKLWEPVKPLQSLQPYANPRSNYPGDDFALILPFVCFLVYFVAGLS